MDRHGAGCGVGDGSAGGSAVAVLVPGPLLLLLTIAVVAAVVAHVQAARCVASQIQLRNASGASEAPGRSATAPVPL